MDKIEITLCTDKNFLMPAGVLIRSICVCETDLPVGFHVVIDESVTDAGQKDLKDVVSDFPNNTIAFYRVDSSKFANLPSLGTFGTVTQASYYRLVLADILPDTIQKVLYLDGDIVVRKPLADLWRSDIDGYALAAVNDPQEATPEKYGRLGFSPDYSYFNAGVLLINLAYWRSHNATSLFNDYMQKHRASILFHDQDVLNAVFHDQWKRLPITYNLTSGYMWQKVYFDRKFMDEVREVRKDPAVVHFTADKPWEYCRTPNPFRSTFFKYHAQTKWANVPLKDHRSLYLRVVNSVASKLRQWGLKKSISPYLNLPPVD